jgi:hypothetical protein
MDDDVDVFTLGDVCIGVAKPKALMEVLHGTPGHFRH